MSEPEKVGVGAKKGDEEPEGSDADEGADKPSAGEESGD